MVAFSLGLIFTFLSAGSVSHAARLIKVGVYQNKPKVFIDEQGQVQGIFIDILEYIGGRENWDIEYVPGTWEQCLNRLENGDIDLLVDIAYSDERVKRFDYHELTILNNWAQVYMRKGADYESVLDLEGKRLAVLKGDISYHGFRQRLKQFNVSCQFVEVDEFIDIFQAVEQGIAEAGLISRLFGLQNEKNFNVDKSPIICCPVELRYAAPKGKNADLLKAIDYHLQLLKIDKTSLFYKSQDKWLGVGYGFNRKIPKWLYLALSVFAAAAIFFFIIHLILNARIRKMTAVLREKNEELFRHKQNLEEIVAERTRKLRESEKIGRASCRERVCHRV